MTARSLAAVALGACAVCCAGPVLGVLAAIAAAGFVGTLLLGGITAGAVVALVVALAAHRHRRARACDRVDRSHVPVAAPRRRLVDPAASAALGSRSQAMSAQEPA